MTPESIMAELLDAGIEPAVSEDGQHILVPAGRLTDAQRSAILAHKAALIARIRESARLTCELLDAAMRACDHWRDGPEAREQMRQDVLATPQHLRADLLAHFRENYGGADAAAC